MFYETSVSLMGHRSARPNFVPAFFSDISQIILPSHNNDTVEPTLTRTVDIFAAYTTMSISLKRGNLDMLYSNLNKMTENQN